MSSQAFLLQTRGISDMKLEVYKPEEILVNLVIRYDEIVDAFASVPKFIKHGEDLSIHCRFNPRSGDLVIESFQLVCWDDSCDGSTSREISVTGDIQKTFLQPLASRIADGIRLSLAEGRSRVIC